MNINNEVLRLQATINALVEKLDGLQLPPTIYTNRTLSEYLHLDQKTLAKMRAYGEINYVRAGKKILFTQDDVNEYINRNRVIFN